MDARLVPLADQYKATYHLGDEIWESLRGLYAQYIKEREQTLMDAVVASDGLGPLFMGGVDLSKVTPQMRETFELAYPNLDLETLAKTPEAAAGILSGWKGKYIEVLVRDKLNPGEQVDEVFLTPEQKVVLADSPIQSGWGLQLLDADGAIDKALQLKATNYLSPVKDALERYPDIDVLTTVDAADAIPNQILSGGLSDEDLIAGAEFAVWDLLAQFLHLFELS